MMRRQNRNPVRRGDPYPTRTRIPTEDSFFDFVVRRPFHPKVAERRLQRLDEEEESEERDQYQESRAAQEQQQLQQQQQQSRGVGGVLLGSIALSHPAPPTPASHQSRNLLSPTTGFPTPSNQSFSPPQDVFAQNSGQGFPAPNAFSPANNTSFPSPATPSHAPATLSPDTNTASLNSGSLAVTQRESTHVGPSNPAPVLYRSPGFGSQAGPTVTPWQPGFFIIGPTQIAQRWDVTFHFQLQTSAISRRVAQHHGFTLETGPPGWNNWAIQTPGGIVQPQHFVRGVTVMSTSNWLPIPTMSDDFLVLDLDWTGGDVVLARPILTRILNNT